MTNSDNVHNCTASPLPKHFRKCRCILVSFDHVSGLHKSMQPLFDIAVGSIFRADAVIRFSTFTPEYKLPLRDDGRIRSNLEDK